MTFNKLPLVVVAALAALLTSACFEITLDYSFNEDGSGNLVIDAVFDSSVLEPENADSRQVRRYCDTDVLGLARDAELVPRFSSQITSETSRLDWDGSCVISATIEFGTSWYRSWEGAYFSETERGWRFLMDDLNDGSLDALFRELRRKDFTAVDLGHKLTKDASIVVSADMPGLPSVSDNADRVIGNRYIWNLEGRSLDRMLPRLPSSIDANRGFYLAPLPVYLYGLGDIWVETKSPRNYWQWLIPVAAGGIIAISCGVWLMVVMSGRSKFVSRLK